jgi:hypothetical protein
MLATTRAVLAAAVALAPTVVAGGTTFVSTWKAPVARPLNFKGKKVAALVISKEKAVRFGAEDYLAREITQRGAQGLAAYGLIPEELTQDKEKAKAILEKEGVAGVVAMRVVGKDQQMSANAASFYAGPAYATFWGSGYYSWGWGGVYDASYLRTDTIVSVETLVFSLEQDKLVWAGVSQTTNPTKVPEFIKKLTAKVADELKKQGLIKKN